MSLKAAAAAFSVSPATAHRWWHRWLEAAGEASASAVIARAGRTARRGCSLPELQRADLRLPPRDRLGAAAGRRRDRLRALDRLEGAQAGRALAAAAGGQGAGQPLRVALPRRSAAHGHCRYARFLRPGHRVTGDRSQSLRGRSVETRVGYDFAHAIVDDHSRLAYVELHDDEKAATVTGFVERALAFFAEHGIIGEAADDRQRLQLRQEPLAARAARPPRHPPPDHRALPATHQRQGRALPPDDGARMGLRPQPTAHIDNATRRCHTGSTTTTANGHTAHSATGHRSAAFTTSVGRTTSGSRQCRTYGLSRSNGTVQ